MPRKHVVKLGEEISSIAFQYGFRPEVVWEDPDNAGLRLERENGHVLQEGDVLTIPDLRPKSVPVSTGRVHTFRRRGVPEKLRLQLLNGDRPRANLDYLLTVDGVSTEGRTDAEGRIEIWISPAARSGKLLLGASEEIDLQLGYLRPVTTDAGMRARLKNLGFLDDEAADAEALSRGLRAFQQHFGLESTGVIDDDTRQTLLDAHRS
jgi:hypothetical protein